MAKRYNHQVLSEAIKQGQARMKQTMTEGKTEPPALSAEPQKQVQRERVHIGIGMIPARRKKPVRINRSYLVFALVFISLVMMVYWVGRNDTPPTGPEQENIVETEMGQRETAPAAAEPSRQPQEPARQVTSPPPAEIRPRQEVRQPQPIPSPEKDHVIVIATYTKREHLLPAQEYFNTNGVKTEIMRRGSYYLLVTSDRFISPLKTGSDCPPMLQKIKVLGTQYKAPDGYENFGRIPFQDAYAMKIKN